VQTLHNQGVREVSLVTYRFLSGTTVTTTSAFGHQRPADSSIAAAIVKAKSLGMTVTLNPFIQKDEAGGIGSTWRGTINFSGTNLTNFFSSYQSYILEMADLAQQTGVDRLMVGSELELLSRNTSATPKWKSLIAATRIAYPGRLSYAANWDQYNKVTFWSDLDEIGVDAYFPLASDAEATGQGNPATSLLVDRWSPILAQVQAFAAGLGKPAHFSETGTVPRDKTTVRPWESTPSAISDTLEQRAAYEAILQATDQDASWFSDITFWHWNMSGASGSLFHVTPTSQPGQALKSYLTLVPGDLNGDGGLDNEDIGAFVLALVDEPAFKAQYPRVGLLDVGDLEDDGALTNEDISPFVVLLTAGDPVPEPSTLLLSLLAMAVLSWHGRVC
jgi:hypothetical protein